MVLVQQSANSDIHQLYMQKAPPNHRVTCGIVYEQMSVLWLFLWLYSKDERLEGLRIEEVKWSEGRGHVGEGGMYEMGDENVGGRNLHAQSSTT